MARHSVMEATSHGMQSGVAEGEILLLGGFVVGNVSDFFGH